MRYLFFLLSFLYSFIFYVFYTLSLKKDIFFNNIQYNFNVINLSIKDSIIFSDSNTIIIQSLFGNLLYEIIIFAFISIFLFFYFSSYTSEKDKTEAKNNIFISNVFTFSNFMVILKKFSYYIGFAFFYLSLYLISISFKDFISFSLYIFIINIIIFFLYFISNFSLIARNFLRINLFIFSFFYLVNYFIIIFGNNNYFELVDFLNSFLILLIFPILIYFEKINSSDEKFDKYILINFSIYIFGAFIFYFYYYLFHQNLLFRLSIISTIFGIIWFEYLPKLNYLKKEKIVLKYIGILFTYLGIICSIIYQIFYFSWQIFFILILLFFYNLFIHKKYTNYISLFLGVVIGIYLVYFTIIHFDLIDYRSVYFLYFNILLSFIVVIITYIIKLKIILDYYIIHIFCHLINIAGVIIFFIFNDFDILKIGILLLIESIYFFLSYYKLF